MARRARCAVRCALRAASAREIRELFLVVSFILLSLVAPLLSIIKNLLQVVLELVKYVPTY